MIELWALYVLMGFMIGGAIAALEMKDLLSAVIAVAAAGAALSIIFLMLGAPDLAITQVVVEVLSLVILIRAVVVRRDTTADSSPRSFPVAAGLIFGGVLLGVSYLAFSQLNAFGHPLFAQAVLTPTQTYLAKGLLDTGAANYVTGVLLDYRAYDTLGEATVIFTAIIGAYAILRPIGRIRHERHDADR